MITDSSPEELTTVTTTSAASTSLYVFKRLVPSTLRSVFLFAICIACQRGSFTSFVSVGDLRLNTLFSAGCILTTKSTLFLTHQNAVLMMTSTWSLKPLSIMYVTLVSEYTCPRKTTSGRCFGRALISDGKFVDGDTCISHFSLFFSNPLVPYIFSL